jgi:type II secretory pathway predicted ATPase ExeA
MSTRAQRPFLPADPPPGTRLELAVIAAELRITMREIAECLEISRSAAFRLACSNYWPTRMQRSEAETYLRELFTARGASAEQLATLFHAHVSRHPPAADPPPAGKPDRYGRTPADRAARLQRATDHDEDTDMLLPKQILSPDARKAFQLLSNPFDGEVVTAEQMFTSPEIAYVREVCMRAAFGGGFVAVVSESGGGKTTILGDLEERITLEKRPVQMIKPWTLGMEDNDRQGKTLKSADILHAIITTLDPLAHVPATLQARSNRARDLLIKSAEAGFCHLLVIEEAHALPESTLKHLKRLHEMRLGRKPLLGILLLGQTELAMRLDPRRANLREVTQRCELVQLLPLDADLQAYLEHRARASGRELRDFIDHSGVEEIRARLTVARPAGNGKTRVTSLLYPLAVNNLLTAALNKAAELHLPVVTRDVVSRV